MSRRKKIKENKNMIQKIRELVLDILGINKDNNVLFLNKLDNNKKLQDDLIKLGEYLKEYFATSTWTYFKNLKNNKANKRSYLTLLRNILDFLEIQYISKQTSYLENKETKYVTIYVIYI